jgi:uncharacterized protein YjdB
MKNKREVNNLNLSKIQNSSKSITKEDSLKNEDASQGLQQKTQSTSILEDKLGKIDKRPPDMRKQIALGNIGKKKKLSILVKRKNSFLTF